MTHLRQVWATGRFCRNPGPGFEAAAPKNWPCGFTPSYCKTQPLPETPAQPLGIVYGKTRYAISFLNSFKVTAP
jgi:hypothetical protein